MRIAKVRESMFSLIKRRSPWGRRVAERRTGRERPSSVTVTFDQLELYVGDFIATHSLRGESLGWLGLCVGFLVALVSSDYSYDEARYFLSGPQWQAVLVTLLVLSTLAAIWSIFRGWSSPSLGDLLSELAEAGGATVERRALFIVKRPGRDGGKEVLVYKSPTANCWFLPNVNINGGVDDAGLRAGLAGQLGLDIGSVDISEYDEERLLSKKHSTYFGRELSYEYRFYFVALDGRSGGVEADECTVGGRRFAWHSIAAMQEDPTTQERNGDVLKYISERSQLFLIGPADSVSGTVPASE